MLPKTNEIISVVCVIQRLVQLGGNLQLVFNCRIMPVCVVKTHTLYDVIIQRFCFISPYIFFYFDFQTIENQCVLFFLLVKYQFKDSGFKSLCIIVLPVKVGDEFLLVKRKSIIGYPIIIYSIEFSILGNQFVYFSCHRLQFWGLLSLSRKDASSSSTSSTLGKADFKFSGIALLNW